MQTNQLVNDICDDLYFIHTTDLKAWQSPTDRDMGSFKVRGSGSVCTSYEDIPDSLYRCYSYLGGQWCYRGIFKGNDRFDRLNNLDN